MWSVWFHHHHLFLLIVVVVVSRRLPVVMVRLQMSQSVREAVALVEQGRECCYYHLLLLLDDDDDDDDDEMVSSSIDVRVGPEIVTDPAFLVTRPFEDLVTWVDSSKIRRHIMKYNDKLDDFVLLGN